MSDPASTGDDPSPKGPHAGLPHAGWTAASVAAGIFVALAALTVTSSMVAALGDSELAEDAGQLAVGLTFGLTALGFAIAYSGGDVRAAIRRVGFIAPTSRALGIALLAFLAYLGLEVLLAPLLAPEQETIVEEFKASLDSTASIVITGFLFVLVAPLGEELFFRGFVFAGLRGSLPLWPAAVISGVFFGSLHLIGANLGVGVLISVLGTLLAWLYERTGTLWAPILVHTLNNALAFTALLVTLQ